MSFEIQNIINHTQPLTIQSDRIQVQQRQISSQVQSAPAGFQRTVEQPADYRSLLGTAKKIGKNIIEYIKDLMTEESSAKSSAGTTTDVADVKGELSRLATNSASNPKEASAFTNVIDDIFAAFSDEKSARDAASNPSLLKKVEALGIDKKTAVQAFKLVKRWDKLSASDKITNAGTIGINVLSNLGVLNQEQVHDYKGVTDAIGILTNSQASTKDKALAAAEALASLGTTSFKGSFDNPDSISGVRVVGSIATEDGSSGFLLENGKIVAQSEIRNSQNVSSAIEAIAILTSNADSADKALALGKVGVKAGLANDVISDVQAGRIGAALSVFQTATNWDKMDTGQRVVSTIQTADTIFSALNGSATSGIAASTTTTAATEGSALASSAATETVATATEGAATSATTSLGGTLLGGAAAIAGIYTGVKGALNTAKAIGDLPRSEAMKVGAIGGATSGAALAAGGIAAAALMGAEIGSVVPIAGTIIGAAVGALAGVAYGAFASSKSKSQGARDAWRNVMEKGGFAKKIDKSHHVPLADGTTYNIGRDGKSKLSNVDGSERKTYQVDWKNPLAANGISQAHIFAIATGLDPMENKKSSLFDKAASQSLNAATSNAKTAQEVQANFKTMLKAGGVDAQTAAIKVEVLRVSNKITDQQYKIYLNAINEIFTTNIQPSDRAATHKAIVQQLASVPEMNEGQIKLFQTLTDPAQYKKSLERLNKQLEEQAQKENKIK